MARLNGSSILGIALSILAALANACSAMPEQKARAIEPTTAQPAATQAVPAAAPAATQTPLPPTATAAPQATPMPAPTEPAAEPIDGEALIESLSQGGYVIYFRHTATDSAQADTSFVNPQDCSTQRNLSEQGRAEAFAIGKSFLALGIPVGDVQSGAHCRARDTALLAFGKANPAGALASVQADQTAERIAAVRALLSNPPAPGTNTVLVADEATLDHAAAISLEEGEAAVFAPSGNGSFTLLARVLPEDWIDLLDLIPITAQANPLDDPDLILPDLAILPPEDLMILSNSDTGGRQLKFSTSIQNSGPGRLEIWGHSDPTSLKTIVVQKVNETTGKVKDIVVGEFVFHPEHAHFHFGNFARYEVWSIGPQGSLEALLSVTDKVSYCLRDDIQVDAGGRPEPQTYVGCNRDRQGITPGWIDVYKFDLFGQTVDVSNLPDGAYALLNYVDPDHQLFELNQENNSSMVYFQLEGNRVSVLNSSQVLCEVLDCEN